MLLPFVLSHDELQATFGGSSAYCLSHTAQLNDIVSSRFRDYVFDDVLGPAGVQASFYPQGDGIDDYALVYNKANTSQPGGAPARGLLPARRSGLPGDLGANYARFLSQLDAGLIVPKALADQMKGVPDNRMGFDTSITGTLGEYVWKNGGCPSANGTKPGCSSLGIVFPNGVQAYVAINSSNNTYAATYGGLDEVMQGAFDEALL